MDDVSKTTVPIPIFVSILLIPVALSGFEGAKNVPEKLRTTKTIGEVSSELKEELPELAGKPVKWNPADLFKIPDETKTTSPGEEVQIYRGAIDIQIHDEFIQVEAPIIELDVEDSAETKIRVDSEVELSRTHEMSSFGLKVYRQDPESNEFEAYPETLDPPKHMERITLEFYRTSFNTTEADERGWGKLGDDEVIPVVGDPPGIRCYYGVHSVRHVGSVPVLNGREKYPMKHDKWFVQPLLEDLQLESLSGPKPFEIVVKRRMSVDE